MVIAGAAGPPAPARWPPRPRSCAGTDKAIINVMAQRNENRISRITVPPRIAVEILSTLLYTIESSVYS
jgi:hypothetical protein